MVPPAPLPGRDHPTPDQYRPTTPDEGGVRAEDHLEEFDFTASSKLPAAQILSLEALAAPLRRVDQPLRPAGLKRHVAHALGHLTVRQGAHVRFAKINQLLADFVGGQADRTWDKRSVNWYGPTCSPLTG
ncbi:ATP-binding protein [Streptomyces sp. NPDC051577]|uniref:ATP-binding protein n=1 Tax=Streptomyces sp. NPDC051577 TaxID=3155166 RepID=UPI003444C9A7